MNIGDNSDNIKQNSVIPTPANQGFDWIFGGINGFLSLFGAGELVDPLGDSRSDYDSAIQNMQDVFNSRNLIFATKVGQEVQNLYTDTTLNNQMLNLKIKQNRQIFNDSLRQENLFMTILAMIIFIIIFYLLFMKKCC